MDDERADPNPTVGEQMAVNVAAGPGELGIAQMLLENGGISGSLKGGFGYTALGLAVRNGHTSVEKASLVSKREVD